MKKYLLILFFSAIATYSFAQEQISIKISPGLSYGRVHTDPDTANFKSDGMALRGKLGAVYDWLIKENYYLSTGAFFVAKQISIKKDDISNLKEQHEIQYLQVPVLLKLYTSEIMLDTRLYVEFGITGALKINDRVTNLVGNEQFVTKLRRWELGGIIGCGVEYNFSLFTSVFAGISYQPAFSSVFLDQRDISTFPKLFGYADLITIDIGIKF
jgi:hypothetical protein